MLDVCDRAYVKGCMRYARTDAGGIIVGANRIRPILHSPNIVFAQYNAFAPKIHGKINGIP